MTGLPRSALKEQILNPLFFLRRVPGLKGLGGELATTRGGLRCADWPVLKLSYLVPACSFKFMQALREQTLFMRIGDFVAGEKPSQ